MYMICGTAIDIRINRLCHSQNAHLQMSKASASGIDPEGEADNT